MGARSTLSTTSLACLTFDVEQLPPTPELNKLPRYGDRKLLARLHTYYLGPLSHRTLEAWPLDWRIVNGRAVASVLQFFAEAQRRFDSAPVVRGGRSATRPATA
jgi:hypothetical protein